MASFYHVCWLFAVQIPTKVGDPAGAAPAANAEESGGGGGMFDGLGFFIPAMLVVMVLYIMLMLRPQQKETAKTKQKLADLKKNERVVTAGGIIGTIVNTKADTEYLTIRIDETNNVKMQILKQSVVRVIKDDDQKNQDD